ncbi:MAG: sigma-70 family RNA polymerase sigma factor [Chitinophagaceae bacterium]|nr:sigma-70 family RNA polymerase sigma factor [Chitinophagaceae bacterium]
MSQPDLIPHLFRTEFRKLTAVLCRQFGFEQLDLAEDIAGDTFLAALENWPYKGVPKNPVAWLYSVAKNKARNQLLRQQGFHQKIALALLAATSASTPELDLSEENIGDSQLQMLFAVCHPAIPQESQIALALRVLCGFGIDEIANAFLSNRETIAKRLSRAKEKLREENIVMELPPPSGIAQRLATVLISLYLVFNEGYYSETSDIVLREDLCLEAIRLTQMLIDYPPTDLPDTNALMALMCFHASRFPARKDAAGELVLYADQDENLWDQSLISRGAWHLKRASTGNAYSKYHLEAGIAYWHTIKEDTKEKWENILQLYNRLLQIAYSPVAALNRTYALWKANGKQEAIRAAEQLKLDKNPYYHTLLGELYLDSDRERSRSHFEQGLLLARTEADKKMLAKKLAAI